MRIMFADVTLQVLTALAVEDQTYEDMIATAAAPTTEYKGQDEPKVCELIGYV